MLNLPISSAYRLMHLAGAIRLLNRTLRIKISDLRSYLEKCHSTSEAALGGLESTTSESRQAKKPRRSQSVGLSPKCDDEPEVETEEDES